VFFDIGQGLLYHAVEVQLGVGIKAAKVQILFNGRETFNARPPGKLEAEAGKGILQGKPGKVRGHKFQADFPDAPGDQFLLADNRGAVRRFPAGAGKQPEFGKHRVVEFAGNAPPLRFKPRDNEPGKIAALLFPLPGFAGGPVKIPEQQNKRGKDKHKKPEQTEIDFKLFR
jgi:hypothetical protein